MDQAADRLDAYHLSLDFAVFVNHVNQAVPPAFRELAEQLLRAATGIVLSLADSAEHAPEEVLHARYLHARGRATESAALLDMCSRLSLLDHSSHHAGTQLLVGVVTVLGKLALDHRYDERIPAIDLALAAVAAE